MTRNSSTFNWFISCIGCCSGIATGSYVLMNGDLIPIHFNCYILRSCHVLRSLCIVLEVKTFFFSFSLYFTTKLFSLEQRLSINRPTVKIATNKNELCLQPHKIKSCMNDVHSSKVQTEDRTITAIAAKIKKRNNFR